MRIVNLVIFLLASAWLIWFYRGSLGLSSHETAVVELSDEAFIQAIIDGDRATVDVYLAADYNPNARNKRGDTALIWAVEYRDEALAGALLERGANPELSGSSGRSPLDWACRKGDPGMIRLLVEKGADVNTRNLRGETPLMHAARLNNLGAVRYLLEKGADPNAANDLGETALMAAVDEDAGDVIELLVVKGADPGQTAKNGETALSKAVGKDKARFFLSGEIVKRYPAIRADLDALVGTKIVNLDERPRITRDALERRVHHWTNTKRREQGLPELAYDPELVVVARTHSEDMARRRFFSHVNPSGENPTQRALSAGYSMAEKFTSGLAEHMVGENIFRGYTFSGGHGYLEDGVRHMTREWIEPEDIARTTVEDWMGSPGHRVNILNPHYDREGVGIFIDKDGKVYITQNFF